MRALRREEVQPRAARLQDLLQGSPRGRLGRHARESPGSARGSQGEMLRMPGNPQARIEAEAGEQVGGGRIFLQVPFFRSPGGGAPLEGTSAAGSAASAPLRYRSLFAAPRLGNRNSIPKPGKPDV